MQAQGTNGLHLQLTGKMLAVVIAAVAVLLLAGVGIGGILNQPSAGEREARELIAGLEEVAASDGLVHTENGVELPAIERSVIGAPASGSSADGDIGAMGATVFPIEGVLMVPLGDHVIAVPPEGVIVRAEGILISGDLFHDLEFSSDGRVWDPLPKLSTRVPLRGPDGERIGSQFWVRSTTGDVLVIRLKVQADD